MTDATVYSLGQRLTSANPGRDKIRDLHMKADELAIHGDPGFRTNNHGKRYVNKQGKTINAAPLVSKTSYKNTQPEINPMLTAHRNAKIMQEVQKRAHNMK